MTWRQWWWHFKQWIGMFPLRRHDDHCWIGLVNCSRYSCWCGAVYVDPDETPRCARCPVGMGGEDDGDEPCPDRQADYIGKGAANDTRQEPEAGIAEGAD